MKRWPYLLAVFFLWPSCAGAQPLFRGEHNWTFDIGAGHYGLAQGGRTPGEGRYTTIWFGRCCVDTRFREIVVIAFFFYPPANALAEILCGVKWRSWRWPLD